MNQTTRALPAAQLQACLAAAVQAPSIHNTQPWRFVLHTHAIDLHADLGRQLPVVDPTGRALHISCGAALLNLRLAIADSGRHSRVTLLPDRAMPAHLATVWVDRPREVSEGDRRLARAIWRRHTCREPFADRPLPDSLRDGLIDAARHEDARLRFVEHEECDALLAVVRSAESRERRDPAYRAELSAWTGGDGQRDDGVPVSAYGSWSVMEILPLRDFAVGKPVVRRAARFESKPTIAVLSVFGDEPPDWVRAGMALERVLLEATASGLASSMMTQPLDIPDLRDLLAGRSPLEAPQAILRLGVGPPGAASPRRPLDEVVENG
jgi:nitroreductase